MGKTLLSTEEIGSVQRNDFDITTTTQAVITKVIAGTGVTISSTGIDAGTGDVTINSSGGSTITLAAIGTTPNINAATLVGSVLNLEPASVNFGGIVTVGTQSLAGTKSFVVNNILNTTTDGLILANNTVATSVATIQQSPALRWLGSGWNTSSLLSNNTEYRIFVLPASGGSVSSTWKLQSSINGGTFSDIMTLNTAGATIPGTVTASVITGTQSISTSAAYFGASGSLNIFTETWVGSSNSTANQFSLTSGSGTMSANSSRIALKIISNGSALTTAATGIHNFVSTFAIKPFVINAGATTVTNAATLYIESAATGTATITNNYALWVNAGTSRFDGDIIGNNSTVTTNSHLPLQATNAGKYLTTDGTNTSWASPTGTGDMVLAATQTVIGAKTYNSGTLLFAGATSGTTTLNATAVAGTGGILTLPIGSGTLALTSQITGINSGTNTGDVTLGAIGIVPNANGASLSGQVLTLQPADAINGGVLTNTTQSILGIKNFKSYIGVQNAPFTIYTTLQQDRLTFSNDSISTQTILMSTGVSAASPIITFPSISGIVVISVNGSVPNSAGNIVLTTGITRIVNSISTATTALAAASTDYIYFVSGTTTLTLPTAVGNTSKYTIKNVGVGVVTILTTGGQTIDAGAAPITITRLNNSLDLISDNANFKLI